MLCLVPAATIESAINETRGRHKEEAKKACDAVFHWYGSIVNINPALFNFVVSAYECMIAAGISLTGEASQAFNASYRYEENHGYAHYIDGRLTAHAGNIDQMLADIMSTECLQ